MKSRSRVMTFWSRSRETKRPTSLSLLLGLDPTARSRESSSSRSNRPRRSRPVTRFRPFRNSDPPALVKLWNQAVPEAGVASPLRVHELDSHALGTVNFEAAGLIVAERDGRIVGFVHAGFGPDASRSNQRSRFSSAHDLGTVCHAGRRAATATIAELVSGLIAAAESYLACGCQSGVCGQACFPSTRSTGGCTAAARDRAFSQGTKPFHCALIELGYQPAGTTVLLEADLTVPEPRDPRAVLIRRQTQIEFLDDALPDSLVAKPGSGRVSRSLTARLLLQG